jgi:hypothetical protein
MALQTGNLVMVGLGIQNDTPPNAIQPPLVDGNHLRWAFTSALGFPWYGFYLFRRPHRDGTPLYLSSVTGSLTKGPLPGKTLDTTYGQMSSDQNLILTDDFPPSGTVEFDLDRRTYLRFTLAAEQFARSIEARVGFRLRAGDPTPTQTCVDFSSRSPGSGPNPRVEQGVTFEAHDQNGKVQPVSQIRSLPGTGGQITGLDCGWGLNITLPGPATFVQLTITHFVVPATIEAFNADGTSAGTATMQNPRGGTPETLTIAGSAITRVVVYADQNETLLNQFCFGNARIVQIQVTAISGNVPVAQSSVKGYGGQVMSTSLEFDGITALELSSDSAALIDLDFVPLSQDATVGWEQVPNFTYPMRLPVTQPAYPCTPGMSENLAAARTLARQRIQYGDPQQFTAPPTMITTTGTISVVNGSPIVTGSGTSWTTDLVNAVLQVKGDPTAYVVVMVVSPNKLVLSRNYVGTSANGVAYSINQDNFGQFHDQLLQLVTGGSAASPMASRTMPAPIYTTGTVSVSQDSPTVTGSGMAWNTTMVGLAFQLAGEPAAYTISSVDSPTQLTLNGSYRGTTGAGKTYRIIAQMTGIQSSGAGGIIPQLPQHRPLDTVLLGTLQPAVAQMAGLYWVDQKVTANTAYDYLIVADSDGSGGLDPVKMLTLIQQSGFSAVDGSIVFDQQAGPLLPLSAPTGLRVYALPGSSRLTASGTLQQASNNVGLRWELAVTDLGALLPGKAIVYNLWRADLGNGTTPTTPGTYNLLTKDRPVLVTVPQLDSGQTPQRASDWPPFPLYAIDNALQDGWYSYQVSGVDIFGRHSLNSVAGPWYQWTPPPEPPAWYYQYPPSDSIVHPFAVRLLVKIGPPAPTAIEAYALDPADPTVVQDAAYTTWWQSLSTAEQNSIIGLRVRWLWTTAQVQQAPNTREFRIYYHPGQMNALPGHVLSVSAASGMGCQVVTDIENNKPANAYVGASLHIGSDAFAIVGSDAGSPLSLRVRTIGTLFTTGTISVTNGSATVTGAGTSWGTELAGRFLLVTGEQTIYTILSADSPSQLTLSQVYTGSTGTGKSYSIFAVWPRVDAACTVAIPPIYGTGTISVVNGSRIVTGTESNWNSNLAGMALEVVGDQTIYIISSVDSPTQLTLDSDYAGITLADQAYAIQHPLFIDYSVPINWEERYYVVDYNSHATLTTDDDGQPLRVYEVLLPAAGDSFRGGVPLSTSLTDPIVYARIGVSSADDKTYTQDTRTTGSWSDRFGNEGHVGAPATIFRVRRDMPPSPVPPAPPDPEHSYATPADSSGHSFYTYRWQPATNLETHIFRALDDTLLKIDWGQRPRTALDASQTQFFPNATIEPRWDVNRRTQVATELNQLNSFTHDSSGAAQAMAYYQGLSYDALRVLAGLPGNEAAFTQLTVRPLDPNDPANADRRGPDTPASYTPNPNLRAYVDTLEGLSTNRYCYRAIYVDEAHNRSSLSLASPPVSCPDVVAPRTPVITKVLGGDRQITISWASNREPDLKEYRVYRTDNAAATSDLGQMTLVHTEAVPAGDPATWPAEVVWIDTPVPGLVMLYYRLVAADGTGNVSEPSPIVTGRAFDNSHPDPPTWNSPAPGPTPDAIVLSWTSSVSDLTCLVQRSPTGAGIWTNVSGWLPRGTYTFTNTGRTPGNKYDYRLWVLDNQGRQNVSFNVLTS